MSLRSFINAGYAILVDELSRHPGSSLHGALERVSQFGIPESELPPPTPDPVDNAKSMETLMGMMGGVKGAPV